MFSFQYLIMFKFDSSKKTSTLFFYGCPLNTEKLVVFNQICFLSKFRSIEVKFIKIINTSHQAQQLWQNFSRWSMKFQRLISPEIS